MTTYSSAAELGRSGGGGVQTRKKWYSRARAWLRNPRDPRHGHRACARRSLDSIFKQYFSLLNFLGRVVGGGWVGGGGGGGGGGASDKLI